MKKIRQFLIVCVIAFTQCLTGFQTVYAKEKTNLAESELYAKSCALADGDSGRLLFGKDENNPMANASTTKILTCILALENCKMDDVVTFSKAAASQPKVHLGTKEGEQFYLQDLLYGLMLESYNDCAYAIAEHVAGSVEEFAKMMNEKAEKIGCTNSHFVTPNGLDKEDQGGEHHTTAADLCRIMAYCTWNSPASAQFIELTQTRNHSFNSLSGTGYAVSNKNAFLDMMPQAVSGKTGYTSKAGYCYVAAAEDNGRHYVIALLASGWPNHKNYRWSDAKKLFQYGLDHYHLYRGSEKIFQIPPVQLQGGYRNGTLEEWGKRLELPLYVKAKNKNLTFLKADWDEAKMKREIDEMIDLPLHKGKRVGKVSYCINDEIVYSYPVCVSDHVEKWNLQAFFKAVINAFLPA